MALITAIATRVTEKLKCYQYLFTVKDIFLRLSFPSITTNAPVLATVASGQVLAFRRLLHSAV